MERFVRLISLVVKFEFSSLNHQLLLDYNKKKNVNMIQQTTKIGF